MLLSIFYKQNAGSGISKKEKGRKVFTPKGNLNTGIEISLNSHWWSEGYEFLIPIRGFE